MRASHPGDRRGVARGLALGTICGPSMLTSAAVVAPTALAAEVLACERPVRLAAEIGWRAGEAFCMWVLADCFAWRGLYDRALALAGEALALAEDMEHLEWQCGAERMLGVIALDLFDVEAARRSLTRAHAIAVRLGSRSWIRWTAAPLAIALARQEPVVPC